MNRARKGCALGSAIAVAALFTVGLCHAQQQPMFTQYMFNGLVLNPAYAGVHETFTATAVLRQQWVGIDGSPRTQVVSAHSPLDVLRTNRRPGSRVSLGMTLFNDQVAITQHMGLLGSYAYRLQFGENVSLSFGLQAGVSELRIRYSELELDDPAFAGGDFSEWQPEFGAGIYLKGKRIYAGLSAPQLLGSKHRSSSGSFAIALHYFFTAGYIMDAGSILKIKPNLLVRSFDGGLFQWDVNCNFYYKDIVEAGASWRSLESFGALVRFQVDPRIAIGYAYDIPGDNELVALSGGSHEIMLNYTIPRRKVKTINPRFF